MRRIESGGLAYYQFEHLASHLEVVHGVFTRQGGASVSPWASLNLSGSTGDSPEATAENKRRMLAALNVEAQQVASAWLNHGDRVAVAGKKHGGTALRDTDALISSTPGVVLSMRFADCVPVLFHDAVRGAIGIAHAGWPGVAAGIVGKTVQAMQAACGCRPRDVWAGIGPAIRVECYPFGLDQAQQVIDACPPGTPLLVQSGQRVHLDLIAAVQSQLSAAGIQDIEDSGLCTACRTDEWFSHRKEKGQTGRFGIILGLRAQT